MLGGARIGTYSVWLISAAVAGGGRGWKNDHRLTKMIMGISQASLKGMGKPFPVFPPQTLRIQYSIQCPICTCGLTQWRKCGITP